MTTDNMLTDGCFVLSHLKVEEIIPLCMCHGKMRSNIVNGKENDYRQKSNGKRPVEVDEKANCTHGVMR